MYQELATLDKEELAFFTSILHDIIKQAEKDDEFLSLNKEQQEEVLKTQLFITLNNITTKWSEEKIDLALKLIAYLDDYEKFVNTFLSVKLMINGFDLKKYIIIFTTEGNFNFPEQTINQRKDF